MARDAGDERRTDAVGGSAHAAFIPGLKPLLERLR
jgi:hypothetical protein